MNQSEIKIVDLVSERATGAIANTTVTYSVVTENSTILLHGNKIAEYDHFNHKLRINFCGYVTQTTKSRINALLEGLGFDSRFVVKQGVLYLIHGKDKKEINPQQWYEIKE